MTHVMLWPILAAGFTLMIIAAALLSEVARRQDQIDERIRVAQGRRRSAGTARANRVEDAVGAIRRLGGIILQSGILSSKTTADLEQTLAAAGYRPASALPLVVGGKVALMGALPFLAWFLTEGSGDSTIQLVAAFGGVSIGLFLPDLIIGRLRKRYLAEVERGLPDALDLLVICADAGLPLETALDRVAMEFRDSDPPTANELALTANEMKMLPDRRQALVNIGLRTNLETLVALGGTLAQTLQYGTPLTQALRVLSNEMRDTMLVRFEEKAARLPVLLTLPMIGFFLPCVIIVVLGPAGVQVYHMLHG
nr:type II secretion system F family protein [uncultured Rhodopila sp.]